MEFGVGKEEMLLEVFVGLVLDALLREKVLAALYPLYIIYDSTGIFGFVLVFARCSARHSAMIATVSR